MTKRFELINTEIEGANTVKLVKDVETGNEYTLKEIIEFMNLWHEDDVVSIVLELNELKKENKKLKERINELDEECAKLCNFNLHNILDNKNKEIKKLNSELNKYYKKFNCHQCHYHNYNGTSIDYEYEVCDKGNNEALDDNHSCSEWEEL